MRIWPVLIIIIAVIALVSWVFRPVCVPILASSLQDFNVPIEQRTDRDLYLKVFQFRDGQWHQCKTWLSRQLFF